MQFMVRHKGLLRTMRFAIFCCLIGLDDPACVGAPGVPEVAVITFPVHQGAAGHCRSFPGVMTHEERMTLTGLDHISKIVYDQGIDVHEQRAASETIFGPPQLHFPPHCKGLVVYVGYGRQRSGITIQFDITDTQEPVWQTELPLHSISQSIHIFWPPIRTRFEHRDYGEIVRTGR